MPRPFDYNAQAHYWYVGGDQTQAYSSAVGDFVPAADATFTAWLNNGHVPTNIDTNANLAGVVVAANLATPVNSTVLALWRTVKVNAVDTVIFKVLFNHENRIRTLASQVQVTIQQFMTAISSLL